MAINPNISHATATSLLPPRILRLIAHITSSMQQTFLPAMAALHPHLFQSCVLDEAEVHKLVANYFLQDRAMLPWRPTAGEGIPKPNTNEIVVFSSFFQCEYGLSAYDFFP
jgi:hypothetical protein